MQKIQKESPSYGSFSWFFNMPGVKHLYTRPQFKVASEGLLVILRTFVHKGGMLIKPKIGLCVWIESMISSLQTQCSSQLSQRIGSLMQVTHRALVCHFFGQNWAPFPPQNNIYFPPNNMRKKITLKEKNLLSDTYVIKWNRSCLFAISGPSSHRC